MHSVFRRFCSGSIGVLLLAITAGCDSGGESSPNSAVADLLEAARGAGADEQVAILEDGVVSDEEYLEAVSLGRACVAALRLEVSEIVRSIDGVLGYTFAAPDDGGVVAADECQARHYSFVQQAYTVLNPPDIAGIVAEVNRCATDRGIAAVEAGDLAELADAVRSRDDQLLIDCCAAVRGRTVVVAE